MNAVAGRSRGAAMVETALVMSLVLMLLFGALRLAIVGYYQMTADVGAFELAHFAALGVGSSQTPQQATQSIFTVTTHSNFALSTQPNPAPTIAVPDFGAYNYSNASQRIGGNAFLRSVQESGVVTATTDGIPFVNHGPITLNGISAEPQTSESGYHFNITGSNFNSAGDFSSRKDYYAQGENAPPYSMGLHFMNTCLDGQGSGTGPYFWYYGNGGCASVSDQPVGIAALLDANDYGAPINGVDQGATFYAMKCHAHYFAVLAQSLAAAPTIAAAWGVSDPMTGVSLKSADSNNYFESSWDTGAFVPTGGGLIVPNATQQYPLTMNC
ncbi:MAG: TadE/TadG family type IV pilus assembly protein [Vulcanimicrobiaceae bacterium]